jgi:DNA-binding PadR family transcriptional regulator
MNLIDYNFRLNSIIKEGILTTNEIALMFVIINLQNTLRSELFGLPTRTTSAHLNLSHPTYYRTLEGLQSKGLIAILEQGKKNQAPIIRITFDKKILANPFSISQFETNAIKENEQMLLKNFIESVHINKKEERIKNKKNTNSSSSIKESFQNLKPSDCKDYINEQLELHLHNIKQATGYPVEQIRTAVDTFVNYQELETKMYHFKSDSFKHFTHWIKRVDLNKVNKPKENRLTTSNMTADEIAEFVASKIIK